MAEKANILPQKERKLFTNAQQMLIKFTIKTTKTKKKKPSKTNKRKRKGIATKCHHH